jgi:fructose-1,6-bisphosphatase-3
MPQLLDAEKAIDEKTLRLIARMHKAITIIQFKLEGQMYKAHPEWKMTDRCLLENVDLEHGCITLNDKQYDLRDTFLPTVNVNAPYELTAEEADLMNKLARSFSVSERLKRHVGSLLSHGGMYAVCNSNLLFHASVPLNEDGSLREVEVCGMTVKGRELLTRVEQIIRTAFDDSAEQTERKNAKDYFWYLWSGPDSPLYGKLKMATFERYLIADSDTHVEGKGWYYMLRNSAEVCDRLMDEFEVFGDNRHIINGHVPVRASRGENPVKADGRLMVIDGGFAKAYHNTTGIAGYTLVFHSRGFELVQHEPFTSTEEAVRNGTDIRSTTQIIEMTGRRIMVKDTDMGKQLRIEIADLENLLRAYRKGLIKEK